MDSNSPSTADFANATANDAREANADQAIVIVWLIQRIETLEGLLAVIPEPCPIMPSQQRRINIANAREWERSPEGQESARKRREEDEKRFGYRRSTLGRSS